MAQSTGSSTGRAASPGTHLSSWQRRIQGTTSATRGSGTLLSTKTCLIFHVRCRGRAGLHGSCPWHTPSSSLCLSQQPPAWQKADEMFIWSEFAGRRRTGRPGKRFKSPAPSFWPAADSSSYVRTLKLGRCSSAAPPPACTREQPCLGGSHHPPLPLYLAVERHG